jgi:hypothetical protein
MGAVESSEAGNYNRVSFKQASTNSSTDGSATAPPERKSVLFRPPNVEADGPRRAARASIEALVRTVPLKDVVTCWSNYCEALIQQHWKVRAVDEQQFDEMCGLMIADTSPCFSLFASATGPATSTIDPLAALAAIVLACRGTLAAKIAACFRMFAGDEQHLVLRQSDLTALLEAAAVGLFALLGTPKHSSVELRAAAADAMKATAAATAAAVHAPVAPCTVLSCEDLLAWASTSTALAPYLRRATTDTSVDAEGATLTAEGLKGLVSRSRRGSLSRTNSWTGTNLTSTVAAQEGDGYRRYFCYNRTVNFDCKCFAIAL